jgi:hypothetical protein
LKLPWAAVYLTDGHTLKSEYLFFDQMDFPVSSGSSPIRAGPGRRQPEATRIAAVALPASNGPSDTAPPGQVIRNVP